MCKLPVTRYQLAVRCSLSVVPPTHSPRLTPPQPESPALSYWLGLSLPIIEIEKLNSSHHNVFCFSLPQSGSQSDNLIGERGCQSVRPQWGTWLRKIILLVTEERRRGSVAPQSAGVHMVIRRTILRLSLPITLITTTARHLHHTPRTENLVTFGHRHRYYKSKYRLLSLSRIYISYLILSSDIKMLQILLSLLGYILHCPHTIELIWSRGPVSGREERTIVVNKSGDATWRWRWW